MDGRFVNRAYGGEKELATGYLLVACGDGCGRFVNRPYGGAKERVRGYERVSDYSSSS